MYYFVSFIIVSIFLAAAACLAGCGLVKLYHGEEESPRRFLLSAYLTGLSGIILAALIFMLFSVL